MKKHPIHFFATERVFLKLRRYRLRIRSIAQNKNPETQENF